MLGTRKHVRDGEGLVETRRWAIAKDIQQKDLDAAMPTSWGLRSAPHRFTRVILNYFFLRLAYAWRTFMCAPSCEPHVRQAWRRWLSALQLGVLKLAGGVAEWVLRYSGDR